MLTAITRRCAAFAANKVSQIVAVGLVYILNIVTNFSNFLQVVSFLIAGHIVCIKLSYAQISFVFLSMWTNA